MDEKGFQTATPYGDGTDILLSDAPAFVLARYPVLVVASRLRSTKRELRDKLAAYVESGGMLVLTAEASESLGPLLGVGVPTMAPELCTPIPANSTVHARVGDGAAITEPFGWTACPIVCRPAQICRQLATVDGTTAAVEVSAGKGSLLLLASSGVTTEVAVETPIHFFVNSGMPNPYPLLEHVRALVDARLSAQTPFSVGDGLSFATNRIGKGRYLVGLANNGHAAALPFDIQANENLGTVTAVKEVTLLDQAVSPSTQGWYPYACTTGEFDCPGTAGQSTNTTIAGLDFRLFEVEVDEDRQAEEIVIPPLPAPPNRRGLPLPDLGAGSLQDAILLRPTFFDHFDTAVVDWRYLDARSAEALAAEGRWAFRQQLKIVVDFTGGTAPAQ